MKAIVERVVVVLWLVALAGALYNVYSKGVFNSEAWQISAIFVLPVWALQFILTGVKSPLGLFAKPKKRKEPEAC